MSENSSNKKVIAFFDLDHTLLDGANGTIYARIMVKRGMTEPKTLLWITWYTILYKLNRLPPEEVYKKSLDIMSRFPVMEFLEFLDEGYEEGVMPRLYAEGIEVIRSHRERGHLTVVATAASEYIAERVRVQLGADDIIGTPIYVEGERILSRIARPHAYGVGKLRLARVFAAERGTDLSECYFYSDSASDLPLLEAVGHPVLVNPQLKLRHTVKGRGWPILRFKEHASFKEPARPERLPTPDLERYLLEYEAQLTRRR